ncbi:MAG: DNA polymerase III subunit gamma/tau [Pseudomonadota bacterium]
MSYTALARKWRPKNFAEMSGQEHVLRALGNALDAGRVHHAFLFTGTRGVGKTTVARIFAKCLNCERGVSAKPCGVCAACTDIDAGRFEDLIEVDAASRTKVDDTRELLDNVQYLPGRGRYKIYLIDEVHMLSAHSFNALLKTLEEPPPHIKFLLATTDPQKLPVTVLSRCLQFNLKRLPVSTIGARLSYILEQEGIAAEPAALRLVATAADGSLRDALSLLDQLLAFGGEREVREADARAMLGTVDRQQVVQLVRLLAGQDVPALLEYAHSLDQWSPDYLALLDALTSLLARIALFQAVGKPYDDEDDVPAETMAELAAAIAAEDLQLYYDIGVLGRRDLSLVTDQRAAFALSLVRMLAFRPGGLPPAGGTVTGAGARASAPRAMSAPVAREMVPTAPTAAAGPSASALPLVAANWKAIVEQLKLTALAGQLAANCALLGRQGTQVKLLLDARGLSTRNRITEEKLAAALSRYLGEPVKLDIEVGAAEAATATPVREREREVSERLAQARATLESDPNIQALRAEMGATIFPDSVRATSNEEN